MTAPRKAYRDTPAAYHKWMARTNLSSRSAIYPSILFLRLLKTEWALHLHSSHKLPIMSPRNIQAE